MRLAPPQSRAYTYKVTVPPAELPVSLEEFKQHINISHDLTDALLTTYLGAATEFAERYTGRCIIVRTINTFRDFFPSACQNEGYYSYGEIPTGANTAIYSQGGNVGFEIRKSPLVAVNEISYIDTSAASVIVDTSIYYATFEADYSEVLNNEGFDWPENVARRMQAITIDFDCGLFPDQASVEACWKVAIMEHAASIWADRGDCGGGSCSASDCGKLLPAAAKAFYEQKRIRNI